MTASPASSAIPDRPCVDVVLLADGTGTVNGRRIPISPGNDPRSTLMAEACRFASTLGRPVRVRAHDPDGLWHLAAHPDGTVSVIEPPPDARSGAIRLPIRSAPADVGDDRKPAADAAPRPDRKPAGGSKPAVPNQSASPKPPADPGRAITRPSWYQPPQPGDLDRPSTGLVAPTGVRRPPTQALVISSTAHTGRRRYPRSLPLMGALVLGGLVIALVIGLTFPRGDRTTGERPGAAPPGDPARSTGAPVTPSLPPLASSVAVPPGYRNTPAWQQPVAPWTRSIVTDDGTVLTRTPTGQLALIDPRTGAVAWQVSTASTKDQTGPWLSSVDGAPVAALVGPSGLSYWKLPTGRTGSPPSGTVSAAPTTVALPPGATVSWTGSIPMVTLADGSVSIVRSGALVPVTLPKDARALAAEGTDVLAVTETGWVVQGAGKAPAATHPIPPPTDAKPGPLRVEAVGATFVLSVWARVKGEGQIVALLDTRSKTTVIQTALPATMDLRKAALVREPGGVQLALGPVVVDTYAARLQLLRPDITVLALSRGHAWVTVAGKANDIHLSATADFTMTPFGAGQAAVPVGVSRSGPGDRAVAAVVIPQGSGWVLCGLPAGES